MNSSNSSLELWWETITEDERVYAMNLLKYYSEWVRDQTDTEDHVEELIESEVHWQESSEVLRDIMMK